MKLKFQCPYVKGSPPRALRALMPQRQRWAAATGAVWPPRPKAFPWPFSRVPGAVLVLRVETSSLAPAVSRHEGGGGGEAARNKRCSVKNVTHKMAHYFPCGPNVVAWPLGSDISGDTPAETGSRGDFLQKETL